MFFKYLPDFSK